METAEAPRPVPLLNEKSTYIKSLKEAGFAMKEVNPEGKLFNAVVYKKEKEEGEGTTGENNMLFIPAIQGESAGTTHISATFLEEFGNDLDTVMTFNSALSKTGMEAQKYNHDQDWHADQMVEYYKNEITDKDKPIVLVGHSMGGMAAPKVAKRLLEEGYNVKDIIMIAPPVAERTVAKGLVDFAKLGSSERIKPDIPTLYPSPVDIAGFSDRFKELSEKRETKYLSREEGEELAYYELAAKRLADPDKLLLSNMDQTERNSIAAIDDRLQLLLREQTPDVQKQIDALQKERTKLLVTKAKEVIVGTIDQHNSQQDANAGTALRNLARSTVEIKKTMNDLAAQTTVEGVQDVIDYNNAEGKHRLDITMIGGDNDPILNGYDLGDVNRFYVGEKTTYTEINMHSFDHFTLPDDPVRVAQALKRIMDKNTASNRYVSPY